MANELIQKFGSTNNALLGMASLKPSTRIDVLSMTRTMQALIDRGADINHRSECGASPLLAAVLNDNIPAATVLIANGADVNQPLVHEQNHQKVNLAGVPALRMSESRLTYPLLEAQSLQMLDILLKEGADVNAIGRNQTSHRQFSVFDRLGIMAAKKIQRLMRAKPTEKPVSVAFHNTMAEVRSTYVAPWLAGSQTHKLQEIKLLLKAGAIPTEQELEKLDHLREASRNTCQLSAQYIPYPQRRLEESARQLREIHALLKQIQQQATLDAARSSESIIAQCVRHKLSPIEYPQALKECLGLKNALRQGADPTYAITQLAIMRQNNKAAFRSVFSMENGQQLPWQAHSVNQTMKAEAEKPALNAPRLKRSHAMAFPIDHDTNGLSKNAKQEQP